MYFFFHLLTGLILGFLLGNLLKDRRWVIPCAVGAILPDLIDKPLGLVIFAGSFWNGRIFSHTVLAALALGILGLLVLKYRKTPVIVGIAVGVVSHQVLDLMWRTPRTWFYPVYGAFPRIKESTTIGALLMRELQNPLEILLFVLLCTGIGIYVYRDPIAATLTRNTRWVQAVLACGALGLCILSGVFIGLSRGKHSLLYLGWTRPEQFIIGGIVTALAAILLWRWYRSLRDTCC